MPDIFISYPHQEKQKAEQLARELESRGLNTWMAHKQLSPGEDVRKQILDSISSSKAVILLVQPGSKPSGWLQQEYMTALEAVWNDERKVLIPVLTAPGQPPAFLRRYHTWKIPEKKSRSWHAFSNQIAQAVKEPHTNVTESLPEELKKEYKSRLGQLGFWTRQVAAQELINGARSHLLSSDPQSNRKAIKFLSEHYKRLSLDKFRQRERTTSVRRKKLGK